MNVMFSPEVIEYLDALTYKLYQKGYFGFIESAKEYVDKLTDDIHFNIHKRQKKVAPPRFKKYGSHYVTYHANKRTTWYIFFWLKNNRYIIRYITNNHTSGQNIRGL